MLLGQLLSDKSSSTATLSPRTQSSPYTNDEISSRPKTTSVLKRGDTTRSAGGKKYYKRSVSFPQLSNLYVSTPRPYDNFMVEKERSISPNNATIGVGTSCSAGRQSVLEFKELPQQEEVTFNPLRCNNLEIGICNVSTHLPPVVEVLHI